MENKGQLEIYFREPLIQMGFAPRIIVRIVLNIFTAVFIITTAAFLISPIKSLFWLGAFFLLVLATKLFNAALPPKRIGDMPAKGRVNLAKYFSPHTRSAIIAAHERARTSKTNFLLQLCLSLLEDNEVVESLKRLDVNVNEFADKLEEHIKSSSITRNEEETQEVIMAAVISGFRVAAGGNADFIGCGDVFAAVTEADDKEVKKLLDIFGINFADLNRALIFGRVNRFSVFRALPKTIGGFASRRLRSRVVNRAWTSRPTPTLNKFAVDYSRLARRGDAAIMVGHGDEYERLLSVLSSPVKPNALLVGDPGVGKGVVMAHLAYMIAKDKVPPQLFDKRLVSLDLSQLMAGADQAELQTRIEKVFGEIYAAGNIILHIPEIHNLARTGSAKQISAANVIVPLITTNDFPLIGTTYPKEYKQYIEADSAFANAFTVIKVEALSAENSLKVMIYKAMILEREYGIKISYSAVKTSVQIADKYFRAKPLPGSAADLLKEALASASRRKARELSSDDIISVAEGRVNIPIKKAGEDEAKKLLNLEDIIHQNLVDQEQAVSAVAESLREYRSGLGRKGGPIGAFLFVGPTGVGKTELSKILAKIQFGSEDAMIRFDMSQYQDKQSVFQFVGSPDGTMAGLLTDKVLEKPYSLVLLDEFEKAHQDILNIFLQVFDDGRLTDNFGRMVSFENTIIIATSNANSDFIKEELEKGASISGIASDIKKKLVGFFKPELLNRFSSIVVFKELSREDIKKIASLNLKALVDTLYGSNGIALEFSDEAVSKIAGLGYDPVFGARPLREAIAVNIKDPLAKMILGQKLGRGAKIDVVLNGEGELQFNVADNA